MGPETKADCAGEDQKFNHGFITEGKGHFATRGALFGVAPGPGRDGRHGRGP
jgi:hypothetical protein